MCVCVCASFSGGGMGQQLQAIQVHPSSQQSSVSHSDLSHITSSSTGKQQPYTLTAVCLCLWAHFTIMPMWFEGRKQHCDNISIMRRGEKVMLNCYMMTSRLFTPLSNATSSGLFTSWWNNEMGSLMDPIPRRRVWNDWCSRAVAPSRGENRETDMSATS